MIDTLREGLPGTIHHLPSLHLLQSREDQGIGIGIGIERGKGRGKGREKEKRSVEVTAASIGRFRHD